MLMLCSPSPANRYGYGLEYQYDPSGDYERQKGYGFVKAYGREFCKDKANCPPAQTDGRLENLNHLNHLNFNVPTNQITNSASSSPAEAPQKSAGEATNAADSSTLTRPSLSNSNEANQMAAKGLAVDNEPNNKNHMDDIARFYHSQKNAPLPDTLHLVSPQAPSHLVANHFKVNNKILDGLSSNGVSFRSESDDADSLNNLASDSSSEAVSSIGRQSDTIVARLRPVSSDNRLPSETSSKLGHINLLSHIKHGVDQANRDASSANSQSATGDQRSIKENGLSKESESPKQNSQLIDTGGRAIVRLASNHHDFDNDDEHSDDYDAYQIEPYGSQYKGHYDPFAERFDRLPKIVHSAAKQLKKHHSSFESSDHNYKRNYKNYKNDFGNDFKTDYDDLDSHLLGATRLRLTRLQPKFGAAGSRQPEVATIRAVDATDKPVSEQSTVLPKRTLLDKSADGGNDLNEKKNENANKASSKSLATESSLLHR